MSSRSTIGTHPKQVTFVSRAAAVAFAIVLYVTGGAAANALPLDLVVAQEDSNGFPLDPTWGSAQPDAALACKHFLLLPKGLDMSTCTSDHVTYDRAEPRGVWPFFQTVACSFPDSGLALLSVHGHVNWRPVTYTGEVRFGDYQFFPNDDDYDWFLDTNGAGYLDGNLPQTENDGLTLEFKRSETLGQITHGWWHDEVDAPSQAHQRVLKNENGEPMKFRAVAIGLLGIDTKHRAHTELHPAYALAVNTQESRDRSVWQIFARNWGSEGSCSSQPHPLDLPLSDVGYRLSIDLPTDPAYSVAQTSLDGLHAAVHSSVHRNAARPGMTIDVDLPSPADGELIFGQVTLCRGRCD